MNEENNKDDKDHHTETTNNHIKLITIDNEESWRKKKY